MKTKIIYISGNELFDIADIRAAFDTVRATLSLDNDTVLFGVPVDNDDAFESKNISDTTSVQNAENVPEPVIVEPVPKIKTDDVAVKPEPEAPAVKPKKTTRQSRARVVPIKPVESEPVPEPESEQIVDEKPTVPILSVLGAKSDSKLTDIAPETVPESEPETEPIETQNINVVPIDVTPVDIAPNTDEQIQNTETQQVSIVDMLADDDMPVMEREKTLEELLESMTPLGEDEKPAVQPVATTKSEDDSESVESPENDTDATLELLATEFAESADKIVVPAKPEARGKIGKLKNILPFKKAKRDDSGIMGDLFGWAGVANDEDFTIPGFFANATKK